MVCGSDLLFGRVRFQRHSRGRARQAIRERMTVSSSQVDARAPRRMCGVVIPLVINGSAEAAPVVIGPQGELEAVIVTAAGMPDSRSEP